MPTLRLRHTSRALVLDANDRLLLARHDLSARHYGKVLWAPPGGGLEPGETPVDALLRELVEELGHEASADEVRHVWHQEVVSPNYAKGWDGAIHDYFLVRCDSMTVEERGTPDLLAAEGITEFRWWTVAEMAQLPAPEVFGPRLLPDLLHDLLGEQVSKYPIDI